MNRRLVYAFVALTTVCCGALLGNSLRDKYELGVTGPTSELYASAEAAADTAVMSGGVSASSYFDQIRQVLLSDFVDPVENETEMGRGAVRGMLRELGDPNSRFFEPEDWAAILASRNARFSGIGADVAFRPEKGENGWLLPLRIVSVADGGPAEKGGLQPGDWIDEINDKWVMSRLLINDLEAATIKRDKGQMTSEQFSRIFDQLRAKSQRMMTQDDALHEVLAGVGSVRLKILRNGKPMNITLMRGEFSVPSIEMVGDAIRIRAFTKETADRLSQLLPNNGDVTIDVRNNSGGDMAAVAACLEQLLPAGAYAKYRNEPSEPLKELATSSGTKFAGRITVLVNAGTAREAEVFVVALRDRANSQIEGGATAGLGIRTQYVSLPDGSGYSLTTSRFFDLNNKPLATDVSPEAKK